MFLVLNKVGLKILHSSLNSPVHSTMYHKPARVEKRLSILAVENSWLNLIMLRIVCAKHCINFVMQAMAAFVFIS